MTRFELVTSSLPRKRSTPELHRQKNLSERPGSDGRHSAWKADALPTELLSHDTEWDIIQCWYSIAKIKNFWFSSANLSGESRIRTCEVKKQQIYSLSSLAA